MTRAYGRAYGLAEHKEADMFTAAEAIAIGDVVRATQLMGNSPEGSLSQGSISLCSSLNSSGSMVAGSIGIRRIERAE